MGPSDIFGFQDGSSPLDCRPEVAGTRSEETAVNRQPGKAQDGQTPRLHHDWQILCPHGVQRMETIKSYPLSIESRKNLNIFKMSWKEVWLSKQVPYSTWLPVPPASVYKYRGYSSFEAWRCARLICIDDLMRETVLDISWNKATPWDLNELVDKHCHCLPGGTSLSVFFV